MGSNIDPAAANVFTKTPSVRHANDEVEEGTESSLDAVAVRPPCLRCLLSETTPCEEGLTGLAGDIPAVFALALVVLDQVIAGREVVEDLLTLVLAADLDVALERLRHGDDPGCSLVPWERVVETVAAFRSLDLEGPEEGADEGEEFVGGEVDAWAGPVAVAEGGVAAEVGKFGQGFFVGGPGGVEPAIRDEFFAAGVEGFFAADEAGRRWC